MAAGARVVLQGVGRVFRHSRVLDDVDLDARAGEVLGLVGPNGGGKSTLLLLMAGLVRPTAGRVTVDGLPAHEVAVARRGTVGLITADAGVYPLLTGWENLHFFGGLYGLSKAAASQRARPLLRELELDGAMDRRIGEWSTGMCQKLSLVRARLLDPAVLLLDEPTANLDPVSADAVYRAVRASADAGLAVVLVTHDLVAAEAVCDRVAFVEGGVRHVEVLAGERAAPAAGRLLGLYRTHVDAR
jgi:ABC-type multidrug transport system ATPase subunit